MINTTDKQLQHQVSFIDMLQMQVVAISFMLMGAALMILYFAGIMNDSAVFAEGATGGEIVWNFIKSYGIVRNILVVGVGVILITLGFRMMQRQIRAARWANIILIWMLIVVGLGTIQAYAVGANATTDPNTGFIEGISNALLWIILLVFIAVLFFLLHNVFNAFIGDEERRERQARAAWTLLAPTLAVFIVLSVTPLENVFITSLTNERFASSSTVEYIGLDNYAELLGMRLDFIDCERDESGACVIEADRSGVESTVFPRARDVLDEGYRDLRYRQVNAWQVGETQILFSARDRDFVMSMWNSILYTFLAITTQLVLAMMIAMILASNLRGISLLRVAMLIPLAIPTLIATQFWDVILAENSAGVANSILLGLGAIDSPMAWLIDPGLQIPSVALVIIWKETPTMALLLLPGLLSIGKEIYQAANVDGANRWQRFWRITLPMMRPTIGVALILRTMVTLRVFDVFDILLGPPTYSMSTYAYDQLTLSQQLGYSSTVSVAIFAIVLIFTVIYMRTLRIDES